MDKKKWFKSKTVWSAVVTGLIGIYEVVKTQVAPEIGFSLPAIPPILLTILGALGVYGRISAEKKIG